MKRYMLFAGYDYYPTGGMRDFIDSFDELDVARTCAVKLVQEQYDWYHVYDLQENIIAIKEMANY